MQPVVRFHGDVGYTVSVERSKSSPLFDQQVGSGRMRSPKVSGRIAAKSGSGARFLVMAAERFHTIPRSRSRSSTVFPFAKPRLEKKPGPRKRTGRKSR